MKDDTKRVEDLVEDLVTEEDLRRLGDLLDLVGKTAFETLLSQVITAALGRDSRASN